MSMSISATASGLGAGFDPSRMASMVATRMMKDLDPGNTGQVTKDQFVSTLTAKGVSDADATKLYDTIDTKKSGSIGKADIEAALKNGSLAPPAPGMQGGPAGTGTPGGKGGPGGAGHSEGASSSSSTKAAADTNGDGVVSTQEALVYAMKQLAASAPDGTNTDPSKLGRNVDVVV
jgi:hypothetical protein